MWCCSIVHKVQSFIIVPLRNIRQYETVKHLLYYHPVYMQNKTRNRGVQSVMVISVVIFLYVGFP